MALAALQAEEHSASGTTAQRTTKSTLPKTANMLSLRRARPAVQCLWPQTLLLVPLQLFMLHFARHSSSLDARRPAWLLRGIVQRWRSQKILAGLATVPARNPHSAEEQGPLASPPKQL